MGQIVAMQLEDRPDRRTWEIIGERALRQATMEEMAEMVAMVVQRTAGMATGRRYSTKGAQLPIPYGSH